MLLWIAVPAMAQTTDPDALSQVWERMIEAKGGRDRLLDIDSVLRVQRYSRNSDEPFIVELFLLPDQSWHWFDEHSVFPMSVQVHDPKGIWYSDGGTGRVVWQPPFEPRIDGGGIRLRQIEVQAIHLVETRWFQPELLGLETERIGRRLHDVLTVGSGATRFRYYVDRETALVRRVDAWSEALDRGAFDTWDLGDYVLVDGVMMASRTEKREFDLLYEWEFSFNVDYDTELFDRPPTVEDGPDGWKRRSDQQPRTSGLPTAVSSVLPAAMPVAVADPGEGAATPVVVDVAVSDTAGQPVTTLSRDAFQVFEDGSIREIVSIEHLEIPHHVFVVDDCVGVEGMLPPEFPYESLGNRYSARYDNYIWNSDWRNAGAETGWVPFQAAVVDLLRRLVDPYRVALAEFGDELRMLRNAGELPTNAGGVVRMRGSAEANGPDCIVGSDAAPSMRFDERLAWMSERLESMPGRKSVVWFGPPKFLPGVFRSADRVQLRNRGQALAGVPFEETAEILRVRDAIQYTGASFYFVLSEYEFNTNYYNDQERKQRRYWALRLWAEASDGQLLLLDRESDIDVLIDRLNREPATSYRLTYLSSPNSGGSGMRGIEVRVDNPALRVFQSRTRYRED